MCDLTGPQRCASDGEGDQTPDGDPCVCALHALIHQAKTEVVSELAKEAAAKLHDILLAVYQPKLQDLLADPVAWPHQ